MLDLALQIARENYLRGGPLDDFEADVDQILRGRVPPRCAPGLPAYRPLPLEEDTR